MTMEMVHSRQEKPNDLLNVCASAGELDRNVAQQAKHKDLLDLPMSWGSDSVFVKQYYL